MWSIRFPHHLMCDAHAMQWIRKRAVSLRRISACGTGAAAEGAAEGAAEAAAVATTASGTLGFASKRVPRERDIAPEPHGGPCLRRHLPAWHLQSHFTRRVRLLGRKNPVCRHSLAGKPRIPSALLSRYSDSDRSSALLQHGPLVQHS